LQLIATRKSEQNEAVVDPWTAVHFAAGLALGLVRFPFVHAVIGAALYEGAEQVMERSKVGQEAFHTSGPEIPMNAVVDIAVLALGHWLGTVWNDS
jgi:hypothetical protein